MNADTCSAILGHIDFKTYPAACLVCREWSEIATRVHNRGASLSPILRLLNAYLSPEWRWGTLSRSKSVPIWYILENPLLYWVGSVVCARTDMTVKYILDNPDFTYYWPAIMENPAIPVEHLLTLPVSQSYAVEVSQRPDITAEIVQKYPNYPWVYQHIFRALGVDYIITHREIKWPFYKMTTYYS